MNVSRTQRIASAWLRRRTFIAAPITALVVLSAIAAIFAAPGRGHAAQDAAGNPPSITATGFGKASLPADRAEVQLLLSGVALRPTPTPSPEPADAGTPTATAAAEDEAEEADPLDQVVAAIVGSGNAVTAGDVRVTVSPALAGVIYGPEPNAAARVDLNVPRPRLDLLNTLVTRVRDAASANGLTLDLIGVRYLIDDCEGLQREAEAAAIADARLRAQRQAELLGVQLGGVIASTDAAVTAGSLYYGAVAGSTDACAPFAQNVGIYGPGVGVTIPTFDPTAPTEAEVYAQVSLTFVIASTTAATPTDPGVAVTIAAPTTTPVAAGFAPTHLSNPEVSIDLRSEPTTTATVIAVLPPSVPLQFLWEQELDDSRVLWLRFQTEDGAAGWIRQFDATILP